MCGTEGAAATPQSRRGLNQVFLYCIVLNNHYFNHTTSAAQQRKKLHVPTQTQHTTNKAVNESNRSCHNKEQKKRYVCMSTKGSLIANIPFLNTLFNKLQYFNILLFLVNISLS